VALRLRGGAGEVVRQTVLTNAELNAHNTFDRPNVVIPKTVDAAGRRRDVRVVLPPASVNRVDVELH
jgi:alpha-L-arabinofuranosidase